MAFLEYIPANIVPEMLCHAQLMAQGNTARGCEAKNVLDSTVASPAFCIPTSMLIVRFLAVLKPASLPDSHPRIYPKVL